MKIDNGVAVFSLRMIKIPREYIDERIRLVQIFKAKSEFDELAFLAGQEVDRCSEIRILKQASWS